MDLTLFDNPPKPGDLIEIHRGTSEHWAVYVGQNEVVHLIPSTHADDDDDDDVDDVDDDGFSLGHWPEYLDSSLAQVRCEKIWNVVGPHPYHVNNLLDQEYEPRHQNNIVRDALKLVGQVLPYSVASYNSEHFVNDLRYGKPESRQVKNAVAVRGATVAEVATVALGAVLFHSLLKDHDDDDD